MKKLVSAAVIAALVAGAANSEVSIKMNARVRGDLFENRSGEATTENVLFSESNSAKDSVVSAGAADTIKLETKNDYAGVNFAFSTDLEGSAPAVYSYSAWLLFGGLKFRGSYNVGNRTANRVTTDQNNVSLLEGNLQAKGVYSVGKNVGKATESWSWSGAKGYGNSGKLGINKNLAGNFDGTAVGADIDNMDLNITAGKTLAWGLEYGLKDALPGDLTLMAYLLSNKEDESVTTNDDGDTTTVLNSQYAFKADYNQSDLFRVTFDGKVAHQKMAFGLFFSPQMVENLALTFGGTIALDKSGIYDDDYGVDDDVMYWGVDFRARYAFSEAMAATFYANISGMNKSTPTEANADGTYSAGDAKTALDVIGNFTYGLNDLAKLFVEAEYAALSLDSDDAKVAVAKTTLVGQFGAILTAGKGATLTPALRLTLMGLGMDKDSGYSQGMLISVPVVMRVQL